MKLVQLAIASFILLVSASAFAQGTTRYTFDPEDLEGGVLKPDGEGVNSEQHSKTTSLISVRSDFVPEMLKSVDEL